MWNPMCRHSIEGKVVRTKKFEGRDIFDAADQLKKWVAANPSIPMLGVDYDSSGIAEIHYQELRPSLEEFLSMKSNRT